jgi:hypothetical protein
MDRLNHKVYMSISLLVVSGGLAPSAPGLGNEFAAAQLVLGSSFILDQMRVASVPGDGDHTIRLKLKQQVQLDYDEAQVKATVPVGADAGRRGETPRFQFMRMGYSSGETEILAELRQPRSCRDSHPVWSFADALGQHQLRSTLLTEIGPAGSLVTTDAEVRLTVPVGAAADPLQVQTRVFEFETMWADLFRFPATVTVHEVTCEADLHATVRPPAFWQGHSFIQPTTCYRKPDTALIEPTADPVAFKCSTTQPPSAAFGGRIPNPATLSRTSYFAGEGTGGDTFLFSHGQAAHPQSSGSGYPTTAGATILTRPSSTHADPHPPAIPSPAKYDQRARSLPTICFDGGGTPEGEEQTAFIAVFGATVHRAIPLTQAPL